MLVTLELSTEIDATLQVGTTYKVKNVKLDDVDVETLLDRKIETKEDAKYAVIAEAMKEYYSGRTLVCRPSYNDTIDEWRSFMNNVGGCLD